MKMDRLNMLLSEKAAGEEMGGGQFKIHDTKKVTRITKLLPLWLFTC